MTTTLVIVDCDHARRRALERGLSLDTRVEGIADFLRARTRLLAHAPDWLATAHHLGVYNGLHLAHLVRGLQLPTRVIVYGDAGDQALALETRRSGAFFAPQSHLESALRAYLYAPIPFEDRRDPSRRDRRHLPRGGRRATDSAPNR